MHSPAPKLSTPRDKSPPCFAGKLVTNRVGVHRGLFTRVLPPDNQHKRLPDSGALGLRICQANPFSICSSNCVQQFHFYFGEAASQVTVFAVSGS